MLEEGISYPSWGDRSVGRFVIGSTLWFFSILLIPMVVVFGYGMRAMRQSGQGADLPPQWRNWTNLFGDGLRAIVVSFVYALLPNLLGGLVLAAFFFLVVGGDVAGGRGGGILASAGVFTLLFGAVVVILVELLVAYLLPAALAHTAVEGSIAGGFDLDAISSLVFDGRYLAAFVQLAFIWIVTLAAASILSVTVILLPVVLFWGALASARVLGLTYRGVMNAGVPTDSTPSSSAELPVDGA